MGDEATQYSLASKIARYVQLVDVCMASTKADLFVSAAEFEETEKRIGVGGDISVSYDEDEDQVVVEAEFAVRVVQRDDDDGEDDDEADVDSINEMDLLLAINCTFVATYWYGVEGGPEDEELQEYLDAFGEVNGKFNLWPYLREYVDSTARRMGVSSLTIPVYRVDPKK